MGQCLDHFESNFSGYGDTEEKALENLVHNMGATTTNIKIYKKYYMIHKYDGKTSCNNINFKISDDIFYGETNMCLKTINSEGISEIDCLNNLVTETKKHCEDAHYCHRYTVTCNNKKPYSNIKEFSLLVNVREYKDGWRVFC